MYSCMQITTKSPIIGVLMIEPIIEQNFSSLASSSIDNETTINLYKVSKITDVYVVPIKFDPNNKFMVYKPVLHNTRKFYKTLRVVFSFN